MFNIAKPHTTCQQEPKRNLGKGEIARYNAKEISLRKEMMCCASNKQKLGFGAKLARQGKKSSPLVKAVHQYIMVQLRNSRHNWVDIKRETLARIFGCSERYITTITNKLELMGFVRIRQWFEETNRYYPGWALKDHMIRNQSFGWLPALRMFIGAVTLTCSAVFAQETEIVHTKIYWNTALNSGPVPKFQFNNKKEEESKNGNDIDVLSDNIPPRSSMPHQTNPGFPVIELRSLQLTPHGVAELSIYPAEAVKLADSQLAKALKAGASVASPLGYMINVAKVWCRERGVQPEFHKVAQLMREHNIQLTSPKFTTINISKTETATGQDSGGDKRRARETAWQAQVAAARKPHDDEMAEIEELTPEQLKDKLRPQLAVFRTMDAKWRAIALKSHPYPNAEILIAELLAEESAPVVLKTETETVYSAEAIAAFTHIAKDLARYPKDKWVRSLKSHGYDEYIPLVEQLIEEHNTTTLDEAPPFDGDEIYEEVL